MNDFIPNDRSLVPGREPDNRLDDAIKLLTKIDNGEATPQDLSRYIDLSYAYYNDQLKDPLKGLDPAYQKAALHFSVAREGGRVGLMEFCVASLQYRVEQASRAQVNNAPKTRDAYLQQIQNWSRLISQIDLKLPSQP